MQETESNKQLKLQRWASQWRLALFVVWTIFGVGALVYFAGGAIGILAVPLGIVVWTAIFVFTLRGPVNKMADAGLPRILAVAIAFIVLIVCVVVLIMLVLRVLNVGDQIMDMMSGFGSYMQSLQDYYYSLESAYPAVFSDPAVVSIMESAMDSLNNIGESAISALAESVISLTGFAVNTIMCLLFALVVSFWLLLELPRLGDEINRLLGEGHAETVDFLNETFSRVLGGYIKGMVLQCGIIMVGCGICFYFIGVPSWAALAFLVGLCNVLPVLGQWIGMLLVLVLCLFGDPVTAVLALIAAFVVQRIVYTAIYPKIMADSVDVHPVLIIIAMMIGYALGGHMDGLIGGFLGIIIAIPLAAVAKAIFVYYFERKTGRHLVAEDGVFFKGTPNEDIVPDPRRNATAPSPMKSPSATRIARRKLLKKGKLADKQAIDAASVSETCAVTAVELEVSAALEEQMAFDADQESKEKP